MAMAASVFTTTVWRSVISRQVTTAVINATRKHAIARFTTVPSRQYSFLSRLENELGYEKEATAPSPSVTGFDITTTGTIATLTRKYKNEEIKIELDANNSSDLSDEMDDMIEEDEEVLKPVFLPSFTIKITKPNGTCMALDCAFEESFSEGEDEGEGSTMEWDNLAIHSITVLPKGQQPNHLYTADTSFLADDMMDGIYSYIEERGLDQAFSRELLQFFRNHERRCYVKFLEDMRTFVKS